MPYLVTAPLIVVPDSEGRFHHHYQGELIREVPNDRRERLVRDGFIEEVIRPHVEAIADVEADKQHQLRDAGAQRVQQCVEVLEELETPVDLGRPTVRAALEASGHKFSNETIAAAINTRRKLSGTAGLSAHPDIQGVASAKTSPNACSPDLAWAGESGRRPPADGGVQTAGAAAGVKPPGQDAPKELAEEVN